MIDDEINPIKTPSKKSKSQKKNKYSKMYSDTGEILQMKF
jgi:hypothetical protein